MGFLNPMSTLKILSLPVSELAKLNIDIIPDDLPEFNLPGEKTLEEIVETLEKLSKALIGLVIPHRKKIYKYTEKTVLVPEKTELQDVFEPVTHDNREHIQWQNQRNGALAPLRRARENLLSLRPPPLDQLADIERQITAVMDDYARTEPQLRITELVKTGTRKVVLEPEHEEIIRERIEDIRVSLMASGIEAFRYWSAVPLLQMIALAGLAAGGTLVLSKTLPVVAEKALPSTEGVIQLATK